MQTFTLPLWNEQEAQAAGIHPSAIPTLTAFPLGHGKQTAAWIICPGGGYAMKAYHEGEPVARWLNQLGMAAFVLDYRVHPHRFPSAQMDAARAIRLVRYYADTWRIDPHRIGILGFSAGGHLAAGAGTRYDRGQLHAKEAIDQMSSRPDAMILSYPVITFMPPYTHEGSVYHLLGDQPNDELRLQLSHERYVTSDTPMTFIWHTADDEAVPAQNSLSFAEALKQQGVPHELHLYESGPHGLGLAEHHPYAKPWTEQCASWLRRHGWC